MRVSRAALGVSMLAVCAGCTGKFSTMADERRTPAEAGTGGTAEGGGADGGGEPGTGGVGSRLGHGGASGVGQAGQSVSGGSGGTSVTGGASGRASSGGSAGTDEPEQGGEGGAPPEPIAPRVVIVSPVAGTFTAAEDLDPGLPGLNYAVRACANQRLASRVAALRGDTELWGIARPAPTDTSSSCPIDLPYDLASGILPLPDSTATVLRVSLMDGTAEIARDEVVMRIDSTPPVIIFVTENLCGSYATTANPTRNFQLRSTDPDPLVELLRPDGTRLTLVPSRIYNYDFTFTAVRFDALGDWQILATVTDGVGNTGGLPVPCGVSVTPAGT